MPRFDDATIERLIGTEDAENENDQRFKQYFFFNKTYENLVASLPIRILVGHKGIGKSALLRRAYLHNQENQQLAVWVRPNDLVSHMVEVVPLELNQLIESWKSGLLEAIVQKCISRVSNDQEPSELGKYLKSTTKALIGTIAEILKSKLPAVNDTITRNVVENFLREQKVYVYIDDIDRGWDASSSSIRNISALLNAIRDLAGADTRLMFRIGLRSDVYYLVRTADESTDKIERNVVWLSWTNHEILAVMAARIETYFGAAYDQEKIVRMSQTDISNRILSKIITPKFQGRGHWSNRPIHNVLLSLTRKRPRDLVKILHGAARNAHANNHEIIDSTDLETTFESYSAERMQDTINEFRSELPNIEQLLFGMRPTRRTRRTAQSFLYRTDGLVAKLKEIIDQSSLAYTSRKPVSPRTLMQFLYKIDFIVARKEVDGRIDRKYFDQSRFLASEVVDFGYDWEVHPAYRWALEPQDVGDILDQMRL